MSEAGIYAIVDEPSPSPFTHLAVNPLWPLLAIMFGGAWLSWPWFVLNSFALGSPSRRRESLLAAGGLFGAILILTGLSLAAEKGWAGEVGLRYLFVALTVWKLAVSYWLYILQARTFNLWEYFGGEAKNGILVVFVGGFLSPRVLGSLPAWWELILR